MKQSGAALGYGHYAAAITKTASGHYQVTDPAMRSADSQAAQRSDRERDHGGRLHQANADSAGGTSSAARRAKASFTSRIFSAPAARRG